MTKNKFCQTILLLLPLTSFAQVDRTTHSIEDSLRTELRKTTSILKSTQEQADRLTYLLTAKEMALRSTELKDSNFQALVAVQAYNFNKNQKMSPADIDIYRALYKALERFSDPILKTFSPDVDKQDKDFLTKMDTLANKLCSHVKRNMKVDEWERFCSQLPYERTCGTTK